MSKLNDVNTTDIRDAMRLGCRTMQSVFDADDEKGVPFFGSQVRPECFLRFSWAHSESHVPGRHLNAMLAAENSAGVVVDEDSIEQHARAAFFSYSGPVALTLNRKEIGGPLKIFSPHNLREGFHALYALARFRNSSQALDIAEASIDVILDLWNPGQGWDLDRLTGELGLEASQGHYITGVARSIGPLVKIYKATGLKKALELALILKEKAIDDAYLEDGAYTEERFGTHTHSTTCVMSSLAQLADLTQDLALMNRVRAFYDNGLREIRDDLGWVIESSRTGASPDRGEVNNTGDIVETALLLGRWGYPQYYADAERILRAHMLPSQLRDTSFIVEPDNPEGIDGLRNVADRHLGAFGFPAPYGHASVDQESISFNMDIVGGAVASLAEAYLEVVRSDEAGVWVNLLFDHENADAVVQSPYTHDALQIRLKRPGPLWVRIPEWASASDISISGSDETPRVSNGYFFFSQPSVNRRLRFEMALPQHEITLQHRTRNIRTRLRGDEVIGMDNFGADLTFFDPF
jgi:hypothetical protein